jgi:cytochrome oxidase assembly protein ShyY1
VLHSAGVRFGSWYQPADRFWSFQAIEATIFLALAAVLVTLGTWWLERRGRRRS